MKLKVKLIAGGVAGLIAALPGVAFAAGNGSVPFMPCCFNYHFGVDLPMPCCFVGNFLMECCQRFF